MTTVIKGGTIVTADMTYASDVLIDNGVITAIGKDLKGDKVLDASGCYVMPGGIDPHTHLEMPFMGTTAYEDFSSGTRAGAHRRHHHGGRFRPAQSQRVAARRARHLEPEGRQGGQRLFLPHGDHLVGRAGVEGDGGGGQARRQHLQALHGLQGRADGERRRDVPVVPALRRARRPAAGPCRERRRRRPPAAEIHERGHHRAGGPRLFASARGRGRGDQPRHHDRRRRRRAALRRACVERGRPRGDPPGAHARPPRLWRAAHPASDARRDRILQPGLGLCRPPGDVAALPQQEEPGFAVGRPRRRLAAGGRHRPLRLHHRAEAHGARRLHQDPQRHRRSRGPHAASCGPAASRPAG